jgi:hypothetical protein
MWFQCMILVRETYESWMNEFCMIPLLSHEMLSLWWNTPYKKLNTKKIKDNQNANNKIPTKQEIIILKSKKKKTRFKLSNSGPKS